MDLLWCQLFIEAYERGIYDVTKDFIVPALVLYLTINRAVKLSKREFRQAQEIEKKREEKINNQVRGVIKNSLDVLNRDLPNIIIFLNDMGDMDFDRLKVLKRFALDPSYLDSLIRLDIITLSNAIESLENKEDEFNLMEFVSDLNEVKSIYTRYTLEEQRFNEDLKIFHRSISDVYFSVQAEIMLFADSNELSQKLTKLLDDNRIEVDIADESTNSSSLPLIYSFIEKVCSLLNVAENPRFLNTRLFKMSKDYVIKYKSMENEMNTFSNYCKTQIKTLKILLVKLENYRKLLD